jgi:hypothetical protein
MKPVPGARVRILKYFEGNLEVALQSFSLYVNVGLTLTYRLYRSDQVTFKIMSYLILLYCQCIANSAFSYIAIWHNGCAGPCIVARYTILNLQK